MHPNPPLKCDSHYSPVTRISTVSMVSIGSRRPPLPPAPSTNGNLHLRDRPVVYQTGHPMRSRWQSTLRDLLMPTSFRYTMGCAVTSLTLLTLLLIFYFLGNDIHLLFLNLDLKSNQASTFCPSLSVTAFPLQCSRAALSGP